MTERNSRAKRGSLLSASRFGTDVTLLSRLRDRIAAALDDPSLSPRDMAPLSRRLSEVTKELREARAIDPTIPDEIVPDAPFDYSAI